VPALE